jgi:hypothetical protein
MYCEAPQSLLVRLLVMQSLFISAAGRPAEEQDGLGARMRVNKLYDDLM